MMLVNFKQFALLGFAWLLLLPSLQAQDKEEELRRQKKKIEDDIRYTNQLLSETQQSRKTSLTQLSLIRRKINSREQLIATISSEVDYLKNKISQNQNSIDELNQELDELKDEYAKMIYHAYKTKSKYHRIMFVFSADGFDQAFRRLKYMRQYSEYRKKQARLIQEKKAELNQLIADLKQDRKEKVELLARKEQERAKLRSERTTHSRSVENLKSKEQELRISLQQKQTKARELEKKIEEIIRSEMAKKEGGPEQPKFRLTPEQVELSDNFTRNKGRLPWPTVRGRISSYFGTHVHEKLHVEEINNGITIQTTSNATVRAVFNGTVTKVIRIGNKRAVLVRHGEYFTLYDNLMRVQVHPGDEVKTGDTIGVIKTDNSSGTTELNFQIWKARSNADAQKLDPAEWLLKR
ncbi:MAG: peptidoglycan DD-metalloendopeptidase family protein [Bacteroidales bacterium]